MECKAKIQNISRGLKGGYIVAFEVNARLDDIARYEDQDLTIGIKKYREKRSLNANAYFHVLVGKIAEVIGRSVSYVKNDLIASAGFIEMVGQEPAIIKTNIEPEQMMEQEILHTKVCKVDVSDNGELVFFYKVYRGSHTYNTKEMARLIDLTVQQAKDLDIETLPPYELERMKEEWNGQKD